MTQEGGNKALVSPLVPISRSHYNKMTLRARIGNAAFLFSFSVCHNTFRKLYSFMSYEWMLIREQALLCVYTAKVILSCDDSFSMNHLILCDLMTSSLVFVVDLIYLYACKWKRVRLLVEEVFKYRRKNGAQFNQFLLHWITSCTHIVMYCSCYSATKRSGKPHVNFINKLFVIKAFKNILIGIFPIQKMLSNFLFTSLKMLMRSCPAKSFSAV